MIGLGLAHPTPDFDVEEMTMYQTLLTRAAALVLCDNLGVARPEAAESGEDAELTQLLGRAQAGDEALREAATRAGQDRDAEFARYFARRMHRLAEGRRGLLGPLFERLPRPLEG